MSDVYLARDAKLDRAVAVKLLSHELALNPERLQRFHAEARAASSIATYPHILVVHDFGNLDGRPFIVTEFVEGETVRQRLSRGPMPPVDAIDVAVQVGAALSAAHARGLVHRDIKPENVMRRPDGYVKVLDFGLAKLTANAAGDGEFATVPGLVMGTPQYMSPEQVRGQELDARSDIWSLGVLLYEMVGGRRPFAGATVADTIAAISAPARAAGAVPDHTVPDAREDGGAGAQKGAARFGRLLLPSWSATCRRRGRRSMIRSLQPLVATSSSHLRRRPGLRRSSAPV